MLSHLTTKLDDQILPIKKWNVPIGEEVTAYACYKSLRGYPILRCGGITEKHQFLRAFMGYLLRFLLSSFSRFWDTCVVRDSSTSSLQLVDEFVDEGVLEKEPAHDDEETDLQRAFSLQLVDEFVDEGVLERRAVPMMMKRQTFNGLYEEAPEIHAGDQDEGQARPNPGEQDEGQARPNPVEQDEGHAGSNPGDAAES
ncbi:hypothetical protein Tco_0034324 [Tanacetum coccineum]